MSSDDRTTVMLATVDEERRFELIAEFVTADPADAASEGGRLLNSGDARERELGADLLGQTAGFLRSASGPICDILLPRLATETNPDVIQSIVVGLGHARDARAREAVLALAEHESAEVREAVAFAVSLLGTDAPSLEVLRRLSRDSDDDVRDWATFALAESEDNDSATVEALAARADDSFDDAREEAVYGLARRHDPRARVLVNRELARSSSGPLIVRARDELDA